MGNPAAVGDLAAGGTTTFTYVPEPKATGDDLPMTDAPAMKVMVESAPFELPGGTMEVATATLFYSGLGQLMEETLTSDVRGLSGPLTRTFELDPQGNVTESDGVMGDRVAVDYSDLPVGEDQRSSMGVQTALTLSPRAFDLDGDPDIASQSALSSSVIYEPVFNKPFRVEDAEGRVTYFIYDYMENLTLSVPHLEECLGYNDEAEFGTLGMGPHPDSYLWELLNERGIPTHPDVNTGDSNLDGVVDQYCGNVIKIIYPDATIPTASPVAGGTAQAAFELFVFNDLGQLLEHQDAELNVHQRTYYRSDNVDGDEVGQPIAAAGEGGYVRSSWRDAAVVPGSNSGHAASIGDSQTYFVYQEASSTSTIGAGVGQTTYTRSQPIVVTDGNDISHRFYVNSHDQIVETSMADSVGAMGPAGAVPLQYWSKMSYDANGNLIELEVEDSQHSGPGGTKYQWTYDILDQPKMAVEAAGALNLTTEFTYDQRRNLVSVKEVNNTPPAIANPSSVTRWYYDDRNIPYQTTRGFGSAEASTTTSAIDSNGNLTEWTDAAGGDKILVETDGYDRVVQVTARDGTVTKIKYDRVGNVLQERTTGSIATLNGVGPATTVVTPAEPLRLVRYDYDERHRLVGSGVWHKLYASMGYTHSMPSLDSGSLGSNDFIDSAVVYDRLGRPRFMVDSHSDVTEMRYDGLGRVVKTIDPVGNQSAYEYDKNGNVTKATQTEIGTTGGGSITDTFVRLAEYDALNRVRRAVEPNGQATEIFYDSRNSVIRTKDQLGNEINYSHDRAMRLLASQQWLSASGQSASAAINDGTTANIDGKIEILRTWDDLGRIKTLKDDKTNTTAFVYDALGRQVGTIFGDRTTERFVYNADSELLGHLDQAGVAARFAYDKEGRRTLADYTPPSPAAPEMQILGTTRQYWSYDGLGRNWSMADNNGVGVADDVLVKFKYDTAGRVISEQQTLGGVSSPPTELVYQGEGRVTQDWYPSMRVVGRAYDALDRLSLVTEGLTTSPMATTIATKDYVGRGRLLSMSYGNNTALDNAGMGGTTGVGGAYDSNGRPTRRTWEFMPGTGMAQTITDYISTYNGPAGIGTNRRLTETRAHLSATRTDTYAFDSAYRMTAFDRTTHDGTSQVLLASSRTLDGVDKMTAFTDEGVNRMPEVDMYPPSPQQNGLNQYSSFDGTGRDYDKNGGLQGGLEVAMPGGTTSQKSLRFDALKRTSIVRDSLGATEMTYAYDPIGRRIAKLDANGDIDTQFFYDGGWRVLEERDDLGTVTKQFVDGSGVDEHLQYRSFDTLGNPTDYYYHCSSQGFVGALTDSAGAVKEQYEYRWLGEVVALDVAGLPVNDDLMTGDVDESREGLYGNPYIFQGRRLDAETGLYHFRHRQYDPLTGSFVSVDPAGLWRHGQGNGYSALGGDPINHLDPTGLHHGLLIGLVTGAVLGPAPARPRPLPGLNFPPPQGPMTDDWCGVFDTDKRGFWEKMADAALGGLAGGASGAAAGATTGGMVGATVGAPAAGVGALPGATAGMGVGGIGGGLWGLVTGVIDGWSGEGAGSIAKDAAIDGAVGGITGGLIGPIARVARSAAPAVATSVVTRAARYNGGPGVRITRPDCSVIDITRNRVKEWVLETHPKAPPGTLRPVKFPNPIPGTKGLKRVPTQAELRHLELLGGR